MGDLRLAALFFQNHFFSIFCQFFGGKNSKKLFFASAEFKEKTKKNVWGPGFKGILRLARWGT